MTQVMRVAAFERFGNPLVLKGAEGPAPWLGHAGDVADRVAIDVADAQ